MHPHIPIHDLWWLAAGGAGYGARYVRHKVRTARAYARRLRLPDPTDELLQLQQKYGYNCHSLVSIAPGARSFTTNGIEGAIIYGEFGRVWLAAGDPLCPEANSVALARAFISAANREKRSAAFVPCTERFAQHTTELGLSAIKIASAPYFNLQSWCPRGNSAKKLRAGINQAKRNGITVSLVDNVDEQFRRDTSNLCIAWLKSRRAAANFGWLLALNPFLYREKKKLFAARDAQNKLVGVLAVSPIPSRNGWYLEDVLRSPHAPAGTADLLVFQALDYLKTEGAAIATLGTAPLAVEGEDHISTHDHPVIERALRSASNRLNVFYNFEGLRKFKGKFAPSRWESEYALVQHGVMVPTQVAHALLRAIVPGGLKRLLTRQALRSLRDQRRSTLLPDL
ncbi:MAG: phosphatidylglycerol lysyltransferase domain-containing protein [Pyrinomonadaceae bacterium]